MDNAPVGVTNPGDQISYKFTVTNTGNVTLTNVTVTDPLLTVTGGPITLLPGQVNSTTFTATYTITQADINAGGVTNQALASGTPPSGPPVTDLSDDNSNLENQPTVTPLTQTPSIALIKKGTYVDLAPLGVTNPGDQISYAFAVTNTGNVTLTNVTVTDPLPGIVISGGPIASLAPGATNSTTITGLYTITQADINAGGVTNQALASGTPPSGPPVTDTSDDDSNPEDDPTVIPLTQTPSWSVTKVAAEANYDAVGDVLHYTITVINTGNVSISGIMVSDPGATTGPAYSSGDLNTNGILEPTETWLYIATHTITQTDLDAGHYLNTATAIGTPAGGVLPPATDNEDVPAVQNPNITLSKTGTLDMTVVLPIDQVNAGDKVNYVFTVTNTGNVTLYNIVVTDANPDVVITGGNIGTLAPGATATATGVYVITQEDINAGSFTNMATADGDDPQGDPVTDTDDDTQTLPQVSEILLSKVGEIDMTVVDPDTRVDAGDEINYVFVVTNTGNITLYNVMITDANPNVVITGGNIGTLLPGATATAEGVYTITQTDIDAGTFTNVAMAEGEDEQGDPVTDTDDDTQLLGQGAQLTLSKVGTVNMTVVPPNDQVNVGDKIDYFFGVINTGNTTVYNVVITDDIPGVVVIGGTIASLAPGEHLIASGYHILTQADIDAGEFMNVATVTGTDPDGDPVSDSDWDNQILDQDLSIVLNKVGTLNTTIVPPNSLANAGDRINYTFTVTNTSVAYIYNVVISDANPAVIITGANIGTMAPGATVVRSGYYILTQEDIDSGTFTNLATVNGENAQGDPVSDTDDDTQIWTEFPAMTLLKTGTLDMTIVPPADRADAGDEIHYVFTVTNTGNQTLYNIVITDANPDVWITDGEIGTLVPGQTATATGTYILKQSDVDAGIFTNVAMAEGDDPDGDPVTDTDDDIQILDQSGSITLEKQGTLDLGVVAPGDQANPGDKIYYVFRVTNTGTTTLYNVEVTDTNPNVIILEGFIGTMDPGQQRIVAGVYILTQADIDAGGFSNVAFVNGVDPEGDPVADSDDDQQVIPQDPALTLSKTGMLNMAVVSPNDQVNAGDKVNYIFTVTNTGNTTLYNIVITDANPNVVITGGFIGMLPPGASAGATGVYTLTQADVDAGSFTNVAWSNGYDPDDDPVTDSDDDEQVLPQEPAISLSKVGTVDMTIIPPADQVDAGDKVNYLFTVTNTGNTTLYNIVITDFNPAIVITGGMIPSLGPGATAFATGVYTLNQADINAGTFTNVASVEGDDPGGDPVEDTDDDTQVIEQIPEIAMSKLGTLNMSVVPPSDQVNAGDQVNYLFTVTNTGNLPLYNVVITDANPNVIITGGIIGTLMPGAIATATGVYTLTQNDIDAGTFTNYATVDADDPDGDPITDTDDDTQVIEPESSITMIKSGTLNMSVVQPSDQVNAGDKVTYLFTVTNTGNTTLYTIVITDANPNVIITGGVIASLAPGATATATGVYTLTQADIDAGIFTNYATVEGDDPNGDPITDTDDDTQELEQEPSITMAKSGTLNMTVVPPNDQVNAGDQVNYLFTVTNTGNTTLYNIVITDANPGVIITGGVIASLAPGATATATGVYTLTQADIDAGTFTNVATVEGDDPDGNPITDTDDDTQILPQVPSVAMSKVGTLDMTVVPPNDQVNAGDKVTYVFIVINTGNTILYDVVVTDANPNVMITGGMIGILQPGATATATGVYTLTQADVDAGTFTNLATVEADDPDGNPITDSDDDTQVLPADPSWTLVKTSTTVPNTYDAVGDVLTYTLVLTNTGNVSITNIVVTDPLASTGPVYVSGDGGVTGHLEVGETWIYTATHVVTQADLDAGSFINVATATGTPEGGVLDPATDDETITAIQDPSLALIKVGTFIDLNADGMANAGDKITYAFSVKNTGNVTLTNVMITDPMVIILGGPVASLAPGEVDNTTFTAVYTITQADVDAGGVSNQALAIATPPDGPPVTDDSDDDSYEEDDETITPLEQYPEITVLKVALDESYSVVGEMIHYTISVGNTGNVTITGISVTDSNADAGSIAYASGDDGDDLLDVGEVWLFNASHTVTQSDLIAGSVMNVASAAGTDPNGDPVTDDSNEVIVDAVFNEIIANDDDASSTPVVGCQGGTAIASVLSNDLLDSDPATLSNVVISVVTPSSNPDVFLNVSTGEVIVLPGVNDGTYTITYRICEVLNSVNCDQAIITVVVTGCPPCDPATVYAGADAVVCEGSSYTVNDATATYYASLLWTTSGDGTFNNATVLHPVYTPGAADILAGTVTLTLTVKPSGSPDCEPISDALALAIVMAPDVNAGLNGETCATTAYALSDATAANYSALLWTTSGTGTFNDANILHPVYTPGASDMALGQVTLTLTAYGNAPCGPASDALILLITPAPTVFAGPDAETCVTNAFTVTGATAAHFAFLLWTENGPGTLSNTGTLNPTYTPAPGESGTVTLKLTAFGNGSCAAVADSMLLQVTPMPVANAGPDGATCEGTAYQVSGAQASNYNYVEWTTSGLGTLTGIYSLTPTYTPAEGETGMIVLMLTVFGNGSCQAVADEMELMIHAAPTASAGADGATCQAEAFTVQGAFASNYTSVLWIHNGQGQLLNAGTLAPTYVPASNESGVVTLALTAYGFDPCPDAVDVMTLTISLPPVADAGPDGEVCEDEVFTLSQSSAENYESLLWTSSGSGTFSNTGILHPAYIPGSADIAAGWVTLTLHAYGLPGCDDAISSMTLTIYQKPVAFAGEDAVICQGGSYTITDSYAENHEGVLWTSNGPGSLTGATTLHPVYIPLPGETGTVMITMLVYAEYGICPDITDQMVLTITPVATVNAGPDDQQCGTSPYTLDGSSAINAVSVLWTTSGTGTFNNPAMLHATYTPSSQDAMNTSVILTLTATAGSPCPAVSDQMVLTLATPATVDAGDDGLICEGSQFTVTSASAGNYSSLTWTTNDGMGTILNPQTLTPTYVPYPGETGTIHLRLTAAGIDPCPDVVDEMTLTFIPGPSVEAGENVTLCEGSPFTANAAASHFSALLWTADGQGTLSGETTLTPTYVPAEGETGMVKLTLTVTGEAPCGSVSDDILLGYVPAARAFAGPDEEVCENTDFVDSLVYVEHVTEVEWVTTGAGTLHDANTLTPWYEPALGETGDVLLILTAYAYDPCPPVTDTMVLTIHPAIQVLGLTDDAICQGDIYTLEKITVENFTSISWTSSGTGQFDDPSSDHPTYTPSSGDIYNGFVILTASIEALGECEDKAISMRLDILTVPSANAGTDGSICQGETYKVLDASTGDNIGILWTTTGDGTFDDATLLSPVYTPGTEDVAAGKVTLTLTAQGAGSCGDATDGLLLTIHHAPVADAGADQQIEASTSTQLHGTASGGSGNYTYLWAPPGLLENPSSQNPITKILSDTTEFILTVIDKNTGCQGEDFMTVFTSIPNRPPVAVDDYDSTDVDMPVTIDISINDSEPDGDPITYEFCGGPYRGTFVYNGDGTITYTPSTGFVGIDSLCYRICDDGIPSLCDEATVYIFIKEEDCFHIYNGITPNGDGFNDTWYIECIDQYPENEVIIVNRWFDVVRELKNYDNTNVLWDGTNEDGEILPDGTYYYVIKLKYLGQEKVHTGWIFVHSNEND
ncbi:MAG TPA: gliding motility-associated C-terminal domain-containing protein [Bacteroidales bacterium]|nr:gliding motility-associated C-terminal domain-containing protein [Bacteroidales bacterium]